jgi:hypothetical protein
MKRVKIKEFHDWIESQPDDRNVDMRECLDNDPCGCVMVQYGRHNGFPEFEWCGSVSWMFSGSPVARFEDDKYLSEIIEYGYHNRSKTFGELKKDLIKTEV